MKEPFQTEEEQVGFQQHAGAEKSKLFDDLARYGSVSVEGLATRSINPHAENIDSYVASIAYAGLSMQSVSGITSAKVGKRKSRATRKPPIKVFSADSSNFMAMVHRLTGFESSAYLLAGSPQASVLKPFATVAAQHIFTQGVYVPDPPHAGDKENKSFSNDTFPCVYLAQRMPSFSGRKQLDSIDDASTSAKEGLSSTFSSPSGTDRLPPYSHHPVFEALQHPQVSSNSNSWESCGAAFLPNQGDSSKEDCRIEENCLSLFKEQRRLLHKEVGAVRH